MNSIASLVREMRHLLFSWAFALLLPMPMLMAGGESVNSDIALGYASADSRTAKLMISLMWGGTLVVSAVACLATYRRFAVGRCWSSFKGSGRRSSDRPTEYGRAELSGRIVLPPPTALRHSARV